MDTSGDEGSAPYISPALSPCSSKRSFGSDDQNSLSRKKRSKASVGALSTLDSKNDENAAPACVSRQVPLVRSQMETSTHGRLVFRGIKPANFGGFSQGKAGKQAKLDLRIENKEYTLVRSHWGSMSAIAQAQVIQERRDWNELSEAQQRTIVEGRGSSKHSRRLKIT